MKCDPEVNAAQYPVVNCYLWH